jgi:hypothetical protein
MAGPIALPDSWTIFKALAETSAWAECGDSVVQQVSVESGCLLDNTQASRRSLRVWRSSPR